jgi:hypothetical protein
MLAIDLFCGLGGWTEALLAEGYDVIGFDIERHEYGEHRYPGQLVIQDVRTLHGSQFREATLIVASPPCQKYSYMAMPWKRSKAMAAAIRADTTGKMLVDLNFLFDACFRIQAEASLAAGRHIPLIVENVRGAQPWVGRARWNFGSFYLWGDVPALMPITFSRRGQAGTKGVGPTWDEVKAKKTGSHWTNPGGSWFGSYAEQKARGSISPGRLHGKNSKNRKMASAMIAKIPQPLARHIAATFVVGHTASHSLPGHVEVDRDPGRDGIEGRG